MTHTPEPTLLELIRYNHWANRQVLAASLKLTTDQLALAAPGTYGSIHKTLGHILSAEADYVGRLTGRAPQPPFRWDDPPSLEELNAFAEVTAEALLDAIRQVPPDQMVHEEEDGNTIDYQARALFIQVINHGIEHRTNITTILSGMGQPELEIDGWGYLFAHPETFALKETFADRPDAGD